MRIDKYLWCVRLVKTRSLATKLCNSDKIKLNNNFVKASKEVVAKDIIAVKDLSVWRTYLILYFPKSRVGAKLITTYITETTTTDDLLKIDEIQLVNKVNKNLGVKGRPTKKARRDLDKLAEN